MGVYAGPAEYWYNSNEGRTSQSTRMVVQDGLVLNLDAGASTSYPGSGTTWTDLSGNGNNGTLVNGVGFDSGNGGALSFDGSNQYAILGTTGVVPPALTVSMWINFPTITSPYFYTVHNNLADPELRCKLNTTSNKIEYNMYDAGAYFLNANGINTIFSNTWYNFVFTVENSSFKSYVNSVLDASVSGFTYNGHASTNATSHVLATQYTSSYGYLGYSNVKYSQLLLHNKVLSMTEIQQNFNALRSRFGI